MTIFDENGYVNKQVFEVLASASVGAGLGANAGSTAGAELSAGNAGSATGVLDVIADLIRYNTILSVARVGTGHLGASLSIIELLTCVYFSRFDFSAKNVNDSNRDIFVLSKGHAVPALYSALAAKGYIEISELDKLRRLGGLQGHSDISTNGIEANTGSLAMGLSRAVGYALAKKRMGLGGRVIVVVGDGELQEGQIWEAFLSAVSHRLSNLYVVIDNNKVQTDQFVDDITRYGDIARTLSGMGFDVYQGKVACVGDVTAGFDTLDAGGEDFATPPESTVLSSSGSSKSTPSDRPKLFIMDTVKGQGISFMEHFSVLKEDADRYVWHNKAPNREEMERVFNEVFSRAADVLGRTGAAVNLDLAVEITEIAEGAKSSDSHTERTKIAELATLVEAAKLGFPDVSIPKKITEPPIEGESLTPAFSKALLKAAENEKIVVFDADLEADCGLTPFRQKYPKRFFEMGIMEQHMISAAAAFAREGYFPVMNSYTAFLTSRANEHIYNYASEGGRGLFVGHMSGIIPATPGKSHQAYRDIACMKNIPNILMYQPATADDCASFTERVFATAELNNIVYLRLSMVPSAVKLPNAPKDLPKGKSYVLKSGKDAVIIGVGPVVLGECLIAAHELEKEGISVEVRNHPWLNVFDEKDLADIADKNVPVIVAEDHYKDGGFGEGFYAAITKAGLKLPAARHIAIENFTTTGLRYEILKHFGLDRDSIKQRTREALSC